MGTKSGDDCEPVTVSRRIEAPAESIFAILADPSRHPDLDGSGMVRSVVTNQVITGVGDVFVMKMYFDPLGDYGMNNRVVEFVPGRRIAWEPERLDELCAAGIGWLIEPIGLIGALA